MSRKSLAPMTGAARAAAVVFGCLLLAFAARATPADGWPSSAIHVHVAAPAGAVPDVVTRLLAPRLSAALGQPVVVANGLGAGGDFAMELVADARPDGQTLLVARAATLAVASAMQPMKLDPARDLMPITQLVRQSMMIVATPAFPAKDARGLIEVLRARPGKLNYGTSGKGSTAHLAAETLMRTAQVAMNHVPYSDSDAARADLMAGKLDLVIDSGALLPSVRAGKLKLLAVVGRNRLPEFPGVATLQEAGVANIESESTLALMAPAGTPQAIIERLHSEVVAVLTSPDFAERLRTMNLSPIANRPDQARDNLREDAERRAALLNEAHISNR